VATPCTDRKRRSGRPSAGRVVLAGRSAVPYGVARRDVTHWRAAT